MWHTWILPFYWQEWVPAWDGYFNTKRRTFPWWPGLQTQHSLNTSKLCPGKLSVSVCWRGVKYGLGSFLLERQVGAMLHPCGRRGFQPQGTAAAPGHTTRQQQPLVPKHSSPATTMPGFCQCWPSSWGVFGSWDMGGIGKLVMGAESFCLVSLLRMTFK